MLAGKWRKGGTRDGDDVMTDAVKLLGCHVGMDGGTRTDTTKGLAAAAKAWAWCTTKSRIMRVKLDLSLTAGSWRRWSCPRCSTVLEFDPAVVRRETGITRMEMGGKCTFKDVAKWCGIKTVDEYVSKRTAQYTWDTLGDIRVNGSRRRCSPRESLTSAVRQCSTRLQDECA